MTIEVGEKLRSWIGHLNLTGSGPERYAEISLGILLSALLLRFVLQHIVTTVLTLRASALAPSVARRLSGWVKSLDYLERDVWAADGAGEQWVQRRKDAINRLAAYFQDHCTKSIAWGNNIRDSFSDLRFTDANRVPFPFMRTMREKFSLCSVVTESKGPRLRDLDGNWSLDVSGSYGLNLAGFDHYKEWMEKGLERVKDLSYEWHRSRDGRGALGAI